MTVRKIVPSASDGSPASGRPWWRTLASVLLRGLVLLAALAGMVVFAVLLARVTLTPVPGAVGAVQHNLTPGESLKFYLDAPARDAIRQVGGNILLGAPFGVLLPLLAPQVHGPFRTLLTTAAAMLLVEIVQGTIVTGRAFDIDDVILNTAGALLGYLLLGRRIARAVRTRAGRP